MLIHAPKLERHKVPFVSQNRRNNVKNLCILFRGGYAMIAQVYDLIPAAIDIVLYLTLHLMHSVAPCVERIIVICFISITKLSLESFSHVCPRLERFIFDLVVKSINRHEKQVWNLEGVAMLPCLKKLTY